MSDSPDQSRGGRAADTQIEAARLYLQHLAAERAAAAEQLDREVSARATEDRRGVRYSKFVIRHGPPPPDTDEGWNLFATLAFFWTAPAAVLLPFFGHGEEAIHFAMIAGVALVRMWYGFRKWKWWHKELHEWMKGAW